MYPPNMGFTTVGAKRVSIFGGVDVVMVSWPVADVAADLVICDIGHGVVLQIEFRLIT